MASVSQSVIDRLFEVRDAYRKREDFTMSLIFASIVDSVSSLSKTLEDEDLNFDEQLLKYRKACVSKLQFECANKKVSESSVEIAIGKIFESTCSSSFKNLDFN